MPASFIWLIKVERDSWVLFSKRSKNEGDSMRTEEKNRMSWAAFHLKLFYPFSRTLNVFVNLCAPPFCRRLILVTSSDSFSCFFVLFIYKGGARWAQVLSTTPPGTTKLGEERKFLSHMGAYRVEMSSPRDVCLERLAIFTLWLTFIGYITGFCFF